MKNEGDAIVAELKAEQLSRTGEPSTPPEQFKPIELEEVDVNMFIAKPEHLWLPQGARGVFGGQVVGQSLAAATKTVNPEKQSLHSIHSYFLLPGRPEKPIIYIVTRVRDGASFATRHVNATQNGKVIFTLMASFHAPEPSRLDRNLEMLTVPRPETLQSDEDRYAALLSDERIPQPIRDAISARLGAHRSPIDVRWVTQPMDPASQFLRTLVSKDKPRQEEKKNTAVTRPKLSRGFEQMVWMRTRSRLGDDPNIHRAVIAYASDMNLLGTVRGPNLKWGEVAMMASLDHSMWFHAPFRADEWLLYVMGSPRATMSRGLAIGYIFRMDGTLAVTVAQEGLIRLKDMKEGSAIPTIPPKNPSKL